MTWKPSLYSELWWWHNLPRNLSTKLPNFLLGSLHAGAWGQVLRCRSLPLASYSSLLSPALSITITQSILSLGNYIRFLLNPSTGLCRLGYSPTLKMLVWVSLCYYRYIFLWVGPPVMPGKYLSSRLGTVYEDIILLGAAGPNVRVSLVLILFKTLWGHVVYGGAMAT